MLYILNKTGADSLGQLAVVGADDADKVVLLVADAVFLATEANMKHFDELQVEAFYAAKDAVEARVLEPSGEVELVDYDDMAELLEDADKIIML